MLLFLSAGPVIMPCALAAEGGYTNYIPGLYGDFGVAAAPDPGFYPRADLYYYTADASKDRVVQGGKIRADLELDVWMLMVTGLFT